MSDAINRITIEIDLVHARQDNGNLLRRLSRAVSLLYDALDLDRQHEQPAVMTEYERLRAPRWSELEEKALHDPIVHAFVSRQRQVRGEGQLTKTSAAIGAAVALSDQAADYKKRCVELLSARPGGLNPIAEGVAAGALIIRYQPEFTEERLWLHRIVDFPATTPEARRRAAKILAVLENIAGTPVVDRPESLVQDRDPVEES